MKRLSDYSLTLSSVSEAQRPSNDDDDDGPTRVFLKYCHQHPETLSGHGSSMKSTVKIRRSLPIILREINCTSLLDLGCGDLHWISTIPLAGIRYTGVDGTPELVAQTKLWYPWKDLRLLDIRYDKLPQADTVLMRDVLIHLRNDDIWAVIANICRSNARWLLTSCFGSPLAGKNINEDISTAEFRPVDLSLKPFELGDPIYFLAENAGPNKFLARYDVSVIRESLKRRLANIPSRFRRNISSQN